MSFLSFRRPSPWIVAVLGSLGVVTGISFVRAQNLGPPANVTFRPGGGVPVRGVPMAQRPQGISFNSQIGLVGPVPRAVAVNPATPLVNRNLGQNPAPPNNPNFFGFGGQNPNNQGNQGGGALGQGGGASGQGGGAAGVGGGAAGGVGGGNMGAGGNVGMQALGQNFQNPTGNAGFPQLPVGYIGGFTGGGITGSGIAGNSGNLGVGINGGGTQGNQGNTGGVGGFGAGGFGGGIKGVAGAGNNGI